MMNEKYTIQKNKYILAYDTIYFDNSCASTQVLQAY